MGDMREIQATKSSVLPSSKYRVELLNAEAVNEQTFSSSQGTHDVPLPGLAPLGIWVDIWHQKNKKA